MEYDITTDILPGLSWTTENASRQTTQKSKIFYFALTTCAYCKKGFAWLRERGSAFHWMYLDLLPQDQKTAIKAWVKQKYHLKSEMGLPFVIFRIEGNDFISGGFDPEYWAAKAR